MTYAQTERLQNFSHLDRHGLWRVSDPGGLGFFAVVGYARLHEGRVFPGVRALGVRLDGLTADEARDTLHKAVDQAQKDGLRFRYLADAATGKAREVTLDATITAQNDPDFARDLCATTWTNRSWRP